MAQGEVLHSGLTHSAEVGATHERILGSSRAGSRFINVGSSGRVHLIEAGDGTPVVFLHGSGTSSILLLPLLEHLREVWGLALTVPALG